MQKELKELLDKLGVNNPQDILDNNLNSIWQKKYKEIQKSDISLEAKTEKLIQINYAKDKLESFDKDFIKSIVKKKSKKISRSKRNNSKEEKQQQQSKFRKHFSSNEVSKYFSECKKCNGKGLFNQVNSSVSKICEECSGTGLIKKNNGYDPHEYKEIQLVYRGVSYSKTWNKTLNKFGKFKSFLMKLIS